MSDRIADLERRTPRPALLPEFESREAEIAFEDDLIATVRSQLAELPESLPPDLVKMRNELEHNIRVILSARAVESWETLEEDSRL